MIKAEIVAHSSNPLGGEIASILCVFPRIILSEVNTHRMFSRNSASSRAIPFNKMVKMVRDNPFVPVAWQKDHSGMQGTEYFTNETFTDSRGNIKYIDQLKSDWLKAADYAIEMASELNRGGLTKQICNRLLEPFMWHTALITSTEWNNFFSLRCPKYGGEDFRTGKNVYFKSRTETLEYLKNRGTNISHLSVDDTLGWLEINKGQAEIHMMLLAEAMYDALRKSTPRQLQAGDWHIPFGDDILISGTEGLEANTQKAVQIATARCARTSYLNFNGKDDYEADIDLFKSLLTRPYTNSKGLEFLDDDPIHASPAEHCSMAMGEYDYDQFGKIENGVIDAGWCRNFKGWKQLRFLLNA